MPVNAPSLPAPIAAFLSSPLYKNQVQDVLARREAQRRTIAFSDAHKLDRIPLDVLSQAARDAFRASEAMSDVNSLRNRYVGLIRQIDMLSLIILAWVNSDFAVLQDTRTLFRMM
jgi:hypothetical protein